MLEDIVPRHFCVSISFASIQLPLQSLMIRCSLVHSSGFDETLSSFVPNCEFQHLQEDLCTCFDGIFLNGIIALVSPAAQYKARSSLKSITWNISEPFFLCCLNNCDAWLEFVTFRLFRAPSEPRLHWASSPKTSSSLFKAWLLNETHSWPSSNFSILYI